MEPETPTLNLELIQDFATAAERFRVISTPTGVEILRRILVLQKQTDKSSIARDIMYDDRSTRRTLKRMARLGLVRWEPWTRNGRVSLTSTAKKMIRAGGCNV